MPDAVQLSLTKEQFRDLLLMICLGEWVINSTRTEPEKTFDGLASYIYSVGLASGNQDLVDPESVDGKYLPTTKLEEAADSYITDYDEETFWDELAHRLAERDLLDKFGEDGMRRMLPEERFEKRAALAEQYEDEFVTHGLTRLRLQQISLSS